MDPPAAPIADSARHTARPPSAQSWALATTPASIMDRSASVSAFSPSRSTPGTAPAVRSWITFRYSEAPSSSVFRPSSTTAWPGSLKPAPMVLETSSSTPTIPTTGVGKIAPGGFSL